MSEKFTQIDNEDDFNEFLKTEKSVIALFYATWCPYCVKFLPIFKKYARVKPGVFLLVVDDQENIGEPYAVAVVPTIIFFEKGTVSKRLDGVLGVGLNERQLNIFINSCGSPDC